MYLNLALIIASYFIGAIPFGYMAGKLKGIDIRLHGSGNIGSTNVFRIVGKKAGITVQVLDILKGVAPVVAGRMLNLPPHILVISGIAAVCGHNWPIYLKFKGGKGVNTSLGVVAGLMPWIAIMCFAVWAAAFLAFRYVSLGSIAAAVAFPILVFAFNQSPVFKILSLIMGVFVVIRHRSNIKRLLSGTENKFGTKKKTNKAADGTETP